MPNYLSRNKRKADDPYHKAQNEQKVVRKKSRKAGLTNVNIRVFNESEIISHHEYARPMYGYKKTFLDVISDAFYTRIPKKRI